MFNPLIVIHETISSVEEVISSIQNPDTPFSYHTLIALDGSITYCREANYKISAAYPSDFNGESIDGSVDEFAYHIALETPIEGRSLDILTHSGYAQSQYLSLAWLCSKTLVPLERITTHKEVDTSGLSIDPRSFDRDLFIKYYNSFPKTKEIYFGINGD